MTPFIAATFRALSIGEGGITTTWSGGATPTVCALAPNGRAKATASTAAATVVRMEFSPRRFTAGQRPTLATVALEPTSSSAWVPSGRSELECGEIEAG